ncbi:hypothetical protein [Synechococcus elongatus]|uniref:hypothetical protein n=1 Tax=Synechococcus elongatus TaxID=32046 RepID=UPI0030D547AF
MRPLVPQRWIAIGDSTVYGYGDPEGGGWVERLRRQWMRPDRPWYAVGVLPPHLETASDCDRYGQCLTESGADLVVERVEELTSDHLKALLAY